MTIPFEKWSGAGNDFILVEAAALPGGMGAEELARAACPRGLAVGADGLILVDGREARLWNPDGTEPAFCGNGARCLGRFLLERAGQQRVRFRLGGIDSEAWREGDDIGVRVPAPRFLRAELPAEVLRRALAERIPELAAAGWVDAGVPHLLLRFRGAPGWLLGAGEELHRRGAACRRDPAFGPHGTNVDFLCDGPQGARAGWRIRTYERGVEGETLACGTGAVAAALFLGAEDPAAEAILYTRGGESLRVQRKGPAWHLCGPARCVYRGVLPAEIRQPPPPGASPGAWPSATSSGWPCSP